MSEFETWPKGMRDQQVTILGDARNAYLGALVVLSDRTTVYVGGLQEWDDALHGKRVRVTGTLRRGRLAAEAGFDASGDAIQGTAGASTYLEGATWEPAP